MVQWSVRTSARNRERERWESGRTGRACERARQRRQENKIGIGSISNENNEERLRAINRHLFILVAPKAERLKGTGIGRNGKKEADRRSIRDRKRREKRSGQGEMGNESEKLH